MTKDRDVVTQVRKGEPQSYKRFHRACFEEDHGYDDPLYWTFQWFSEEWSVKPTCDACRQFIQREQREG